MKNSSTVPAVNQIESHPFLSNSKLFKWMRERGIEMTAYGPLASVGLEWNMNKNISPLEVPLIKNLAIKYGVTPAAICIKWQIQRGIITIPKSSTRDRIYSNIDVFDFGMTDEEISSIEALNRDMRNAPYDIHGIGKHKYWPFRIPF
jgi:diketogulonate reductase-like aldo/keto reductase